jgi:adenine phosphoribosyltransferase
MWQGTTGSEAERLKRDLDEIKEAIRRIPDWPKPGVVFRDLTTLWMDARLMRRCTRLLYERYRNNKIQKVLGIEARGFVVGAPLAEKLRVGFVPARKIGKLPGEKVSEQYELEYKTDGLEVHNDAIQKGERVLIVDDLMATGGTALATARIVERLGGKVAGFAFVVELTFLNGRERLRGYDVFSLVKYNSEEE